MSDYFELYDFRLRVAALYSERKRATLAGEDAQTVLERFRQGKDDLFSSHPQSALDREQRSIFGGLHYFAHNPAMRFVVDIDTSAEAARQQVVVNARESMMMTTVGNVHFAVEGTAVTLSIYWLDIYGGGLFLPFRDTTCPGYSYGGGRYLFDTIKGSDVLIVAGDAGPGTGPRIVLDFNYAYNPSCAYNDHWVCPLAPVENRLPVALAAGEMKYKE